MAALTCKGGSERIFALVPLRRAEHPALATRRTVYGPFEISKRTGPTGGPGRCVLRCRKTGSKAGLSECQRDGSVALHRDRAGGLPDPGLPRVACDPERGVPGQPNDRRIGGDIDGHRGGKYPRRGGGLLPGEPFWWWTACPRKGAGRFQIWASGRNG